MKIRFLDAFRNIRIGLARGGRIGLARGGRGVTRECSLERLEEIDRRVEELATTVTWLVEEHRSTTSATRESYRDLADRIGHLRGILDELDKQ